ncbi:MarR family winged helix-turn-helix transcriptional regulator [Streptomyces sp. NPDC057499]|uniref:MarR family winged helix-turn-helix transcriptional regulator n=1 Tax=Streptomyces sp. NPDC057499 TaxID=3346150 RepID=UPI00369CE177
MAERATGAPEEDRPGFELPLLLFAGFRSIIDELHHGLAEQGHAGVRPAYGYALQAVGRDGATASEIGRRLGVSKQAAGKTVERLEGLGYVERVDDPQDGRRKLVRLTARGIDVLVRSAEGFDRLRARWVEALGADRVRAMEDDLRAMVSPGALRLDAQSWFAG